jgi:hypothetical protein
MLWWLLALAAGVLSALWTYGARPGSGLRALAACLRGLAVTAAVALLLDAVAGARRPAPPLVALDVSASWLRGRDSTAFASAVRQAGASSNVLLFGDSVRSATRDPPAATDRASRVRPAVERALASGRPLEVITDGELDDPDALAALPGGSRVTIGGTAPIQDLAVGEIRIPRAAVAGDTVDADIGLIAAGLGSPRSRLTLDLGDRRVAALDVDSLGPFGERLIRARIPVPAAPGAVLVRATVSGSGDREPRNDSLAVILEVSPGAGAVLVSTSPDFDVRELAAVLRGTVSLPTRVFYRVATGVWREDGPLTPVAEEEVRRVARAAPLLILDGDTTVLGDPRAAARSALLLVAPPQTPSGEWYPTGTPISPMSAALGGSPWDSLPPLDVSAQVPVADFEILETRRARRLERRVAAVGWERPRRVVLVAASGFWNWRFRGGASAGVHAAFWGSVIDWLSAERSDARAAVPVDGAVRAGERVRWRRGSPTDTAVLVTLTSIAPPVTDTFTLRFPGGVLFADSPALDRGVYDVTVRGGASRLVVNPSAELLPRRSTVRAGPVGAAPPLSDAPRLRAYGWVFAVIIGALCAEWLLRRRVGLR